MKVTVKYGKEVHTIELEDGMTVGGLCDRLADVVGVPRHLQKVIFKGKSVQPPTGDDADPVLTELFKLKEGSKLMLLGRKVDPAREELMQVLRAEDTTTEGVNDQLDGVEAQLDRVEKGFADHLNGKACDPLRLQIASCVEDLEKGLERLDGAKVQPSDRELRKASVVKIQGVLMRADALSERVDAVLATAGGAGGVAAPAEEIIDID
mmetsp:Transcript_10137/g.25994  ORF Transcript_10137/g.25994 Transcript_10137/m.25994 type:complete len:208 (-) Transcript_10137:1447-2070(-)|eukprot:CAMPEP_0182917124 /NCGR_PEP_ID=MMETSP0105_2-20130417/1337_1 /TAXON_ID=81532 ORGANISM="Acanthoeca-like sp., Strain 10tr" /NCGR_SAMPLE_ID=MMETSP0105_2 /ASSEMBLY_ACC=CAM_ASM_000205 /LENGTH=207 /DNA_ID=CAMNT_0025054113 /DNA_START=137 /DNA_END=760 /DNA_ORIENTATION=-